MSDGMRKLTMAAACALSYGACMLAKFAYRPWSVKHELSDAGFAGWSPTFFMVIFFSLIFCFAAGCWSPTRNRKWIVLVLILVSGTVYETIQQFSSVRTFDIADVFAVFGGGTVGFLLQRKIDPRGDLAKPNNQIQDICA
jgi:glycopeptide antibiotics resistance protein